MQTVLETPIFEQDALDIGLTDDDLFIIVDAISGDPMSGDLMPGTGGARKKRFAFGGKGKRGGIRTIYYYGGGDVPIFLIAIVKKGERDDLSQAEKNALREELKHLAGDYRTTSAKKIFEKVRYSK